MSDTQDVLDANARPAMRARAFCVRAYRIRPLHPSNSIRMSSVHGTRGAAGLRAGWKSSNSCIWSMGRACTLHAARSASCTLLCSLPVKVWPFSVIPGRLGSFSGSSWSAIAHGRRMGGSLATQLGCEVSSVRWMCARLACFVGFASIDHWLIVRLSWYLLDGFQVSVSVICLLTSRSLTYS